MKKNLMLCAILIAAVLLLIFIIAVVANTKTFTEIPQLKYSPTNYSKSEIIEIQKETCHVAEEDVADLTKIEFTYLKPKTDIYNIKCAKLPTSGFYDVDFYFKDGKPTWVLQSSMHEILSIETHEQAMEYFVWMGSYGELLTPKSLIEFYQNNCKVEPQTHIDNPKITKIADGFRLDVFMSRPVYNGLDVFSTKYDIHNDGTILLSVNEGPIITCK